MPDPRIARVIDRRTGYHERADRLPDLDHLSEYDAIVLEPTWRGMFGLHELDRHGQTVDLERGALIDELAPEVAKRRAELPSFFALGGLLVIRVNLPTQLRAWRYGGQSVELESDAWFAAFLYEPDPVQTSFRVAFPDRVPPLTLAGSGMIETSEPGHPFEGYLRARRRYECRLHGYVRSLPGAVVLAENRAGEPVAVEFPVDAGSIVVVPPPEDSDDEERLDDAVMRTLAQRVGARREWVPPQERALLAERDEVLARMRSERDAAQLTLQKLRTLKARILDEDVVGRAAAYWRQATAPGVTHENAMMRLYKITDLLREYLGGGEADLADGLGMPLSRIKAIKRVANMPEKNLRHAGVGPTEAVTDKEFADAVAAGHEMVENLIARRIREETAVRESDVTLT